MGCTIAKDTGYRVRYYSIILTVIFENAHLRPPYRNGEIWERSR